MIQRRFSIAAACASALLFAAWTTFPVATANAQTADLQSLRDEVGQLRRELRDLNRQVAASGGGSGSIGTPAAAGSGGNLPPTLAARMEIRLSQLERQISRMTGRIEELNHNVTQVQNKVDKVLSDIELRLAALEKGKPLTAGGTAAPKRSTGSAAKPKRASGAPPKRSGGDPIGGDGKQLASLPQGSPAEQYRYARGFLMRGEYDKAAGALRAFVKKHPNSSLSGSAVYWLGETHYARKRYAQAAVLFAEGFKRYPKSVKAPDNLLKLGMSFARLGKTTEACASFFELNNRYPKAASYVKRRAAAERQRLRCR